MAAESSVRLRRCSSRREHDRAERGNALGGSAANDVEWIVRHSSKPDGQRERRNQVPRLHVLVARDAEVKRSQIRDRARGCAARSAVASRCRRRASAADHAASAPRCSCTTRVRTPAGGFERGRAVTSSCSACGTRQSDAAKYGRGRGSDGSLGRGSPGSVTAETGSARMPCGCPCRVRAGQSRRSRTRPG